MTSLTTTKKDESTTPTGTTPIATTPEGTTPMGTIPTTTTPNAANDKGIANHKKAAMHLEEAAKNHHEAAKHHEEGNIDKANISAFKAQGHSALAKECQAECAKNYALKD